MWEQVGTLPLTSGVKLAGFYPGLPPYLVCAFLKIRM